MDKIPEKHWIKFIVSSFKESGKSISRELVQEMINKTDNHPDYLQQLCHHVWFATSSAASGEMVEEAIDLVIRSNKLHYQDILDALSNTQLNLLYAILSGETKLTAAETMYRYRLGTPRNVSKNKKLLEEKEIIEIHGKSITFNDPMFEYWLRNK